MSRAGQSLGPYLSDFTVDRLPMHETNAACTKRVLDAYFDGRRGCTDAETIMWIMEEYIADAKTEAHNIVARHWRLMWEGAPIITPGTP
jgi:hypothetical protein